MYIDGQMGQARWAGLRTARKSTARHGSDRASGWPGTDSRAVPGPPPRHGHGPKIEQARYGPTNSAY
jgi:hypothetical protein